MFVDVGFLAIYYEDMNNIQNENFYITSDLHLGHRFVSRLRGFDNPNQHDDAVVQNIYDVVDDGSTLIILGDISCRADDHALNILKKVKADKKLKMILTPGNHDKCHTMFGSSAINWHIKYAEVFDVIMNEFYMFNDVLFTHYPIWGGDAMNIEHENPKGGMWAPKASDHENHIICHGHTHNDRAVNKRHVNVNLESCDLNPISKKTLLERIKKARKM